MDTIKKVLKSEYAVMLICVLLLIVLSVVTPTFASASNLMNIVKRTATTGIIALGMTFVVCTGGIDLSVGGQVALIGTAGALLMSKGMSSPMAVLVMLGIGIVVGAANGFFVSYVKLPAFMVTMAMVNVTQGLAFYITTGKTLYNIPESFASIGLNSIGTVPLAAVYLIVLTIISQLVLSKTIVGRKILSVGGNEKGAWYAGINVKANKFLAYVICGLSCGVAAVVITARLMSANAAMGDGMELDAIASSVIGGAALTGGKGNMIGTFAGAIILSAITNWMNLVSVNTFLRDVVKGLIILVALLLDAARKGELSKAKLREV